MITNCLCILIANLQQSSRLLSFVGSNCLLQLPSSTKQTKIKARTIIDVIVTKSIENTYIAPIIKEPNLDMASTLLLLLLYYSMIIYYHIPVTYKYNSE